MSNNLIEIYCLNEHGLVIYTGLKILLPSNDNDSTNLAVELKRQVRDIGFEEPFSLHSITANVSIKNEALLKIACQSNLALNYLLILQHGQLAPRVLKFAPDHQPPELTSHQSVNKEATIRSFTKLQDQLSTVSFSTLSEDAIFNLLRSNGIHSAIVDDWPINHGHYPAFNTTGVDDQISLIACIKSVYDWSDKFIVTKNSLDLSFTPSSDDSTYVYTGKVSYKISAVFQDNQICLIPLVHASVNVVRCVGVAIGALVRNSRPLMVCATDLDKKNCVVFARGDNPPVLYILKTAEIQQFLRVVTSWLEFCAPGSYDYKLNSTAQLNSVQQQQLSDNQKIVLSFEKPLDAIKKSFLPISNQIMNSSSGISSDLG